MHEKVGLEHSSKSTKYELEGSYGDPVHEHFSYIWPSGNQSGGNRLRYQWNFWSIWGGRARDFASPGQSFTSNGRFWTHFVKISFFARLISAHELGRRKSPRAHTL